MNYQPVSSPFNSVGKAAGQKEKASRCQTGGDEEQCRDSG